MKPQTLLIRDKEGKIVSNKQKVLQTWSEYYKKHFELEDGMDNDSGEEWTKCVQIAKPYVEPPQDMDKEVAIRKLKHGNTTGHDRTPAELIKQGGQEIKKVIYKLISKM